MQSYINYEPVISNASLLRGVIAGMKETIDNNLTSTREKLGSGAFSSLVATNTIVDELTNLSNYINNINSSVIQLCELIVNNIPEGYQFSEDSIKVDFQSLSLGSDDFAKSIATDGGNFEAWKANNNIGMGDAPEIQ